MCTCLKVKAIHYIADKSILIPIPTARAKMRQLKERMKNYDISTFPPTFPYTPLYINHSPIYSV